MSACGKLTPRLATAADLDAVQAVVQAAYSGYVARMGREPGPMSDDYAAAIRAGQVHVAGTDGAVQAILVLRPLEDSLLLDNVAVSPAAQRLGLGRLMMEFAERQALQAGFVAITLYTHESMTENIALYTRAGYFETHRIEERGLRRVYMRKALD